MPPLNGYKIKPSPMLFGNKVELIGLIILIHTYFLCLNVERNPIRAFRTLKKMLITGRSFNGRKEITKYVLLNKKLIWSSDIPGWPSKAYNKFIRNEAIRYSNKQNDVKKLQTVIFSITSKCPINCKHCFERMNINQQEYLSIDQLKLIQDKIIHSGVSSIQYSGGEPLVRFNHLLQLIRLLKNSIAPWILTSGYGLSFEKAKTLKEAGTFGVYISFDHWNENEHNLFRGNTDSYNWAVQATSNCQKAGLLYGLSLCARKEFITIENLDRYLKKAKLMGAAFIRILEARKVGNYADKNVELDQNQLNILNDFYLAINNDNKWNNYPIIMYPGYYQREIGCYGAGNSYLYIDSKANLHACPFCQKSVGNILEQPINLLIEKLLINGCHKFKKKVISGIKKQKPHRNKSVRL